MPLREIAGEDLFIQLAEFQSILVDGILSNEENPVCYSY